MTAHLPPEEIIRVLDSMSFFQKRALKKAGFRWDGLHRLAGAEYGAGLVEAVLACHTDLLGREPRADEPEKAERAHRHPGVPGPVKPAYSPRYSHPTKEQRAAQAEITALVKERKAAEREQRRRNPGGRELP